MSSRRLVRHRSAQMLACIAAMFTLPIPALGDEPVPLTGVIARAIAYDPQVRAAQAQLDALRRRAEAADDEAPRQPVRWDARQRLHAPDLRSEAQADASVLESAERDWRIARERAAGRAATAALDLQRHDRLVALARERLADTQRRGADAQRQRAESALADAQADRLAAMGRLESMAGSLVQGVAAFDAMALTSFGNQIGAARAPMPRSVPAGDARHERERRAIDADHAAAVARVDEQVRLGQWQRTLAQAAATTPAVAGAVAVAVAAVNPPVRAEPTAPHAGDPSLEAALSRWLAAWRGKDLARYLESYAADYDPPGMARERWRMQRAARLARPGPFDIRIEAPRWERAAGDLAEVRFRQHYRSSGYADQADKRLVWRKGPQGWRIVDESALTTTVALRGRAPA